MALIRPKDARPLCNATVELISRRRGLYVFEVTVVGKPPHAVTRVYEIAGKSDTECAMQGIERFVNEMSRPLSIETLQ